MIDTRDYASVAEAAERLHLSPAQVRRRLRCGQLKGERVGSQWFVDQSALGKMKEFQPLTPLEVIEEIRKLRREIKKHNGGKDLDVVAMLHESRESR